MMPPKVGVSASASGAADVGPQVKTNWLGGSAL